MEDCKDLLCPPQRRSRTAFLAETFFLILTALGETGVCSLIGATDEIESFFLRKLCVFSKTAKVRYGLWIGTHSAALLGHENKVRSNKS